MNTAIIQQPDSRIVIPVAEFRERLTQAGTLDELVSWRDDFECIRTKLRGRKEEGERQNEAAVRKICIGREIGRRLKEMTIRERGRWSFDKTTGQMRGATRTLPDGISGNEAWIFRGMATPTDAEFEAWVTQKKEAKEEVTEKAWRHYADAYVRRCQSKLTPDLDGCGTDDEIDDIEVDDVDDTSCYTKRTVLMTTVAEHDELSQNVETLADAFGTKNTTDTVLECVRRALGELE